MSSIAATYVNEKLSIYTELSKIRITFFVAVSVAIGAILYSGSFTSEMFVAMAGVFLLACGASALNHFQERDTDLLMDRTKSRPIPSGKISPEGALTFALILVITGSVILSFLGLVTFLLGVTALVWYNIIYTPLKKKYAMAVVPGSLIGAIPPVIGWTATGGEVSDPHILALAMFFFIWQIPHFWLLLLIYGSDYEKAGFPTLTGIFNDTQLKRITFVWIVALAISSFLVPLFDMSQSKISITGLMILTVWLIKSSMVILKPGAGKSINRKLFLSVNIYVLLVVMILSVDKLLF